MGINQNHGGAKSHSRFAPTYEKDDGTIVAATNAQVRKIYDTVLTASTTVGLSAHLAQWGPDWTASFLKNGFASLQAAQATELTFHRDANRTGELPEIEEIYP